MPTDLSRQPAYRVARLLLAELVDCAQTDGASGSCDHLKRSVLRLPDHLIHAGDGAFARRLPEAAQDLVREIERAGAAGELSVERYIRLRDLGEELLEVC